MSINRAPTGMDAYISPIGIFRMGVVCAHTCAAVRNPMTIKNTRSTAAARLITAVSGLIAFFGKIMNKSSRPTRDPFLTPRAEPRNVHQMSRYLDSSSLLFCRFFC